MRALILALLLVGCGQVDESKNTAVPSDDEVIKDTVYLTSGDVVVPVPTEETK